jgi:radical SAM protein with 4Fe4S-binding SPASM domain
MEMSGPEEIIWIITGACNLNCPYCYAKQYADEEEISGDAVLELLEEASNEGVSEVNFTGGEPLLRKDIFRILRKTVDLGMDASLFTNLMKMDRDNAVELCKLDIYVLTSLDGPRTVYERAKGSGSWDRFIKGVELLREHGVPFHINIPISKINYSVVGEALRTADKLGARSVSMIPSMAYGSSVITGSFITKDELISALRIADNTAEELGIKVSVWCAPFLGILGLKNLRYGNCRNWSVMDISPGGKVLLCDVMDVEVADIREGIAKAWEKLKEHPLMRKAMELPEECRGCPISDICLGGCYARAYNCWRKLPSPDPLCPRIKKVNC